MKRNDCLEIRIGADSAKELENLIDHPRLAEKTPDLIIYIDTPEMLSSLLTPNKLKLLNKITGSGSLSVGQLAEELKRHRGAISRDIHSLASFKFIGLFRKGKEVYPKRNIKKLAIMIDG